MARVLELLRTNAAIREDAEITIEANPDDISPESATLWRDAGVNRVSLGVQSFNESVLQWMHRTHTTQQSIRAVETLHAVGIPNISVDLIFALPASLNRDWSADVRQAIAVAPSHVSLYGLTVEPRTPLARWKERGEVEEASEDRYERDFLFAHTALTEAGFEHYEVSNYGRPGFHSRHNSAYWSNVPYAALGPSAHAFDGTRRSWNVPAYTEWVARLSQNESPEADAEILTPENRAAERVYLGLRTSSGLAATDAELALARPWVDAGWAAITDRTIVLTSLGWLRLDALAASLTLVGSR
jgi:oxygen-independent coproporphyrinogen-3 oxidase